MFCLGANSLWAADTEQGKILHDKACITCHASLMKGHPSLIYTREDRRIQSLAALRKRVQRCSVAAGVDWSQEALEDVIAYLNQSYYHFR
ncbi:hypothetical protein E3U44_07035 [Nitrosococcus wardiae]|uniref:Cytochrome c domain-containing protein n=1 Tax=Nitrosococcus wardiae TaxID=1814290 RepID=A0A4V1AWF8_9GAMM|nr:hypothetical protein E3U44_07035 [Nitrosococcus wardiae]